MTDRTRGAKYDNTAKVTTVSAKGLSGVSSAHDLRRQAEKILRAKKVTQPETVADLSLEEIRTAFHELQVHQIELEMQNEELHRTQKELDLARARYFDLYDLAPVGYCTLSAKGLIQEANLTAASLLRVARSALVRQPISRFIVREDQDGYYLLIHRLVAADAARQRDATPTTAERSPEPLVTELRMKKADGTAFWVSLKVTAVNDDHNNFEFRLVLSDISERKKAEKAIRESREQLQALNNDLEQRVERRTLELQEAQSQFLHAEKLAAIGNLSASIAHEFNNPLQGIQSVLKGLIKRAILEAEDRELLEEAIKESDRLKDLIHSLQEFNRPTSGTMKLIDLHKVLDSMLLLHKSDFKRKRISVELDYAEQLPQIQAVSDQIKQVLLNLLINAVDACQQRGGVITVRTWQKDENTVAVAIKDTGIGIRPEDMDRIFQPFYTTKPEIKGTGLGLSVCYGIIKHHGGEICIDSQPEQGTTFTILLPIKNGAAV